MPSWIALDIGNTQTVAGLFEVAAESSTPSRLLQQIRFKTEAGLTGHDWCSRLVPLIEFPKSAPVRQLVVASVVPAVRPALSQAFAPESGGPRLLWVDSSSPRNFELRLPHPEQLGADRIANVAGALGRLDPPFMIVDAGTATTFCLVDSHRRYIGGAIVPGMETAFRALASRAAKLFEVEWSRPAHSLGNTTDTQLQSGIFHAHEAMISGLCDRLASDAGAEFRKARRILTGGCGHFLRLEEQGFEFIPTLTLEGLIRLGRLSDVREAR